MVTEAKKQANRRWEEKNKEKRNRDKKKSAAKTFILRSTDEELIQIKGWVKERENK